MPGLDTLNTLIAVVIVLLLLSLIVQSAQEAIKKLLKLKSRQIEESLVDLFENVLGETKLKLSQACLTEMGKAGIPAESLEKIKNISSSDVDDQQVRAKFEAILGQDAMNHQLADGQRIGDLILSHIERTKNRACLERSRLPLWQFVSHPSKKASAPARDTFNDVMKGFQEIGRVSASSRQMLNSISKEDLMKVLKRMGPDRLLPRFIERLKDACDEFTALKKAMEIVDEVAPTLDGEAGVKIAKLRDTLAPLINDLKSFFKGDSFNPNLALSDVLNLRNIKLGDALDLLGAVQMSVDEELAATPPPDAAREVELKKAQETLREVANHLTALNQKLDAALAPLRRKLGEVENWYDTIMQSFEERYNRGMKTVAFVISLAIAFFLNANIFSIYRDISNQPEKRAAITQAGNEVLKTYKDRNPQATEPQVKTQPQSTASDSAPTSTPDAASQSGQASASPSPGPTPTIDAALKEARDRVDKDVSLYSDFGFMSRYDEWGLLKQKGWGWSGRCLYMALGWLMMAALLSVGAPFWNDTLQSLFGVKDLLRKKGDIKNVEQKSGEGQPKS